MSLARTTATTTMSVQMREICEHTCTGRMGVVPRFIFNKGANRWRFDGWVDRQAAVSLVIALDGIHSGQQSIIALVGWSIGQRRRS